MLKEGQKNGILFHVYGSMKDKNTNGIIEDRIYPEEGGSFTKLVGCSYLYKGYPSGRTMAMLTTSKELAWIMINILSIKAVIGLVALIYIISRKLAKKYFIRLCNIYFKGAYTPFAARWLRDKTKPRHIFDEKDYCKPVQELCRVSTIILNKVKDEELREVLEKLRDLALMIAEHDTAYRFPMQDILPEFNIGKLQQQPIQEIKRVFAIMQKRERPGTQRDKYYKLEKKLIPILRISKKLRKLIVEFLSRLDYEKIKLDEADWYYCLMRNFYDYKGMSIEDRLKLRDKIDKEKGHSIPVIQFVRQLPTGARTTSPEALIKNKEAK